MHYIKSSVIPTLKPLAKVMLKSCQAPVNRLRMMPDFLIVGGQRCGTTSLYNYLTQHPCVESASEKEIQFLSLNFSRGVSWYKKHFPVALKKYYARVINGHELITGEATPYYLFHPHAPGRARQVVPKAKIIILVRNPVDRAYSHYHRHVRFKVETLPFEEAIQAEPVRLQGEVERMTADVKYFSFNHQMYSYLARGIYIDQIRLWRMHFPEEQIYIMKSEDLFRSPANSLSNIYNFLGLNDYALKDYRKHNAGGQLPMSKSTRKRLVEYFEPYNHRLYQYLGKDLGW